MSFSLVQFSCSVMSDSLRPQGLQHARLPCPSQTPGTCSDSYPLSWWCHPTVSSSVISFSSCLQSSPASGSITRRQFFFFFILFLNFTRWSKYWSFSFSISPSNEYSGPISLSWKWFPWLDLLAIQGILKSLLQYHSSKASILQCSAFFTVHLSHPYMTTGKTIASSMWTFVDKVISLLFDMLSRLKQEMATHSSILAWKIPWTEEPG